jgi:hypothetical protein
MASSPAHLGQAQLILVVWFISLLQDSINYSRTEMTFTLFPFTRPWGLGHSTGHWWVFSKHSCGRIYELSAPCHCVSFFSLPSVLRWPHAFSEKTPAPYWASAISQALWDHVHHLESASHPRPSEISDILSPISQRKKQMLKEIKGLS